MICRLGFISRLGFDPARLGFALRWPLPWPCWLPGRWVSITRNGRR